ncbi:hypothetical protein B0G73_10736 [Paraburkholderia sp. BL25I1N1]|nr:hypothetical protein B0G73_10736 [Paraburkholderia sp. BL25I1N1]
MTRPSDNPKKNVWPKVPRFSYCLRAVLQPIRSPLYSNTLSPTSSLRNANTPRPCTDERLTTTRRCMTCLPSFLSGRSIGGQIVTYAYFLKYLAMFHIPTTIIIETGQNRRRIGRRIGARSQTIAVNGTTPNVNKCFAW